MIGGGKTLGLSPDALAAKIGVAVKARDAVNAAGNGLRDGWERTLLSGGAGVPTPRTKRLAKSIRVTIVPANDPTVRVGTPVFYGRILHFGAPGYFEPFPHGDVALTRAEGDMNEKFWKAMQ